MLKNLREIQEYLGHRDIWHTERYTATSVRNEADRPKSIHLAPSGP